MERIARRTKSAEVACFVAASAVAISLAVVPEAGALASRPIHNDFYNGWCLEADPSSPPHNGTPIQLSQCNGQAAQGWTWYNDGTIRSAVDGRCLDEDIAQQLPDGRTWRVQLWDCNGWNNQKWTHVDRGQIINRNDNRAIQAYQSPSMPGRMIVNLNSWLDREDQMWW